MSENLYQLLGVQREATREEIIAAAKSKNAALKKALAILAHPARRKIYNANLDRKNAQPQQADALILPFYLSKTALMVPPLIFLAFLSATVWFAPLPLRAFSDENHRLYLIGAVMAAIFVLWFILSLLRLRRTRIQLGGDALRIIRGILKPTLQTIPLHRIETLEIRGGLWGKLSNSGILQIQLRDQSKLKLSGLDDPQKFRQSYFKVREEFDKRLWTGRSADTAGEVKKTPDKKNTKQPSMLTKARFLGTLEGVSFLLLLGVAMPLKYYANISAAVFAVGSVHGILFVLYLVYLTAAAFTSRMPWWIVFVGLFAAVMPFGPFVLDRKIGKYA